jgi:hypothetical protein
MTETDEKLSLLACCLLSCIMLMVSLDIYNQLISILVFLSSHNRLFIALRYVEIKTVTVEAVCLQFLVKSRWHMGK